MRVRKPLPLPPEAPAVSPEERLHLIADAAAFAAGCTRASGTAQDPAQRLASVAAAIDEVLARHGAKR